MSGFVLARIIQDCKARNKCFTSSPQDATPVQGLHSSAHKHSLGQKEVEVGRGRKQEGKKEEAGKESVKGFLAFQSM